MSDRHRAAGIHADAGLILKRQVCELVPVNAGAEDRDDAVEAKTGHDVALPLEAARVVRILAA
jgi:hypothetical protein